MSLKNRISNVTLVEDFNSNNPASNHQNNENKSPQQKEVINMDLFYRKMDENLEALNKCYLMKYPNLILRIAGLYHQKQDKPILKAYVLLMNLVGLTWLDLCRATSFSTDNLRVSRPHLFSK